MDTVEEVDMVESEYALEAKEEVVVPIRLIFISKWTAQRLMFHKRYGAS